MWAITYLIPLFIILSIVILMQVDWSYRRIAISLLLLCVVFSAAFVAAWNTEVSGSISHPPLLTEAEALAILQNTPEFLEQGNSPAIVWTSKVDPSNETGASYRMAFNTKDGVRIEDAGVSFWYTSGRWEFNELTWRTWPTNHFHIQKDGHLQVSHTPDPIGTVWRRQKDGSYVAEYPQRP